MIALHSHAFTAEAARTLRDAVRGIKAALQSEAQQRANLGKKADPPRYEFTAADHELLEAVGQVRAGDEIELDSTTWNWLQVLLETWMVDAPPKTLGGIWELTGTIAAMLSQAPQRVMPYQAAEPVEEVVEVVKDRQMCLGFA